MTGSYRPVWSPGQGKAHPGQYGVQDSYGVLGRRMHIQANVGSCHVQSMAGEMLVPGGDLVVELPSSGLIGHQFR